MTHDEMIFVIRAHKEGKQIQVRDSHLQDRTKIVVDSGIAPKLDHGEEILAKAREIGELFYARVEAALHDLSQLQHDALEKLEEWTPTERLLTLKEAAAYLKFKPRTLDSWCAPGRTPLIQFKLIGGEKRFRKLWLDNAIDNGSIKPRVVKL